MIGFLFLSSSEWAHAQPKAETPPAAPPASAAPSPEEASDAEISSEDTPAPSASAPAAAPPVVPPPPAAVPAKPAAATPPSTKADASKDVGAALAPSEPENSEDDPLSGLLAKSGYALTPGVSALPVKPDLAITGYLQSQYESHQDSVDQLRQGGALLNQDRFLLRRTRLRATRDWEYAQVIVELDGNTTRGPAVRFQKAEASLIYGRSKDKDQPPLVQLTMGQFDLPFGFEMTQSPRLRWFTERSTGSRALFTSEPDVGARLSGGFGFARYAIAITNGEPLDEKSGLSLQDPNANKDITARFGAEAKASRSFVVAGGLSFNRGKGFSPGTDATKSQVNFEDSNGNGVADSSEKVTLTQAKPAVPSQTFERWAVGADLELLLKTGLGWSMLYGEVVAASNLDRGLFIADPVLSGTDFRELSYFVGLTQEITPYGIVGFRHDFYDPNSDFWEKRAGKFLPTSQAIRTYSPLVGLVLPERARLLFQWDIVKDKLARDSRGVPADFKNNQWTLRLQVVL